MLEGLNSILDHRQELFVPETGRHVRPAPGFRIFGCQNPLSQGGGRKGLPRSFLNRFARVYVEPFTDAAQRLRAPRCASWGECGQACRSTVVRFCAVKWLCSFEHQHAELKILLF